MTKTKCTHEFKISVSWLGKDQEYIDLKIGKAIYDFRLKCDKFQEFVSMMQEARNTQKSVTHGNISIDKLNKNSLKLLQHHNVKVEACCFCQKDDLVYVVNTNYNEYSSDRFSVCKKHLNELTDVLERLESDGKYVVTGSSIFVSSYQEDLPDEK